MKRDNFYFIVQAVTHFIFKVSFRIQIFTDFSMSSVNLKAIPIPKRPSEPRSGFRRPFLNHVNKHLLLGHAKRHQQAYLFMWLFISRLQFNPLPLLTFCQYFSFSPQSPLLLCRQFLNANFLFQCFTFAQAV